MAEAQVIEGKFDACLEDDDTIRTASKLGKKINEGVGVKKEIIIWQSNMLMLLYKYTKYINN